MPVTTTKTATIANGASVSGEIDVGEYGLGALEIPTIDSAEIRFQAASASGGTPRDVYDEDGNVVKIASSTGNRIARLSTAVMACRFIKLKTTDSSGIAVNQTAARTFTLILKPPWQRVKSR